MEGGWGFSVLPEDSLAHEGGGWNPQNSEKNHSKTDPHWTQLPSGPWAFWVPLIMIMSQRMLNISLNLSDGSTSVQNITVEGESVQVKIWCITVTTFYKLTLFNLLNLIVVNCIIIRLNWTVCIWFIWIWLHWIQLYLEGFRLSWIICNLIRIGRVSYHFVNKMKWNCS